MTKRVIATLILVTMLSTFFIGCGKGDKATAVVNKIGSYRSYESQTIANIIMNSTETPGITGVAKKIFDAAVDGFTLNIKKVVENELAGQTEISFTSTMNLDGVAMRLKCFVDYDLNNLQNPKFDIIIPTTDFATYFGSDPGVEYIKADLTKVDGIGKYMPLLAELQGKYKVLNYAFPLDAFLDRVEWDNENKVAISDEYMKIVLADVINDIFATTNVANLLQEAGFAKEAKTADVKERLSWAIEPLINVQMLGDAGISYEVTAGKEPKIALTKGSYAINPKRILTAIDSPMDISSKTMNFELTSTTAYLNINATAIMIPSLDGKTVKDANADIVAYLQKMFPKDGTPVTETVSIHYDDSLLSFASADKPRKIGWSTMVPVNIATTWGATIESGEVDGKSVMICKAEGKEVAFVKNGNVTYVNGEVRENEFSNVMEGDTLFVPVRVMTEAFGLNMDATSENNNIVVKIYQ